MPVAKEAARTALALDEGAGDAHFAVAGVLDFYEWNWAGAEREYRRALELNPGDTLARSLYADLLGRVGRSEEAIAEARDAVERAPLSVFGRHILAIKLYNAGRFDDVVAQAYENIELDPSHHPFYVVLAWALAALRGTRKYVAGALMAVACVGLGRREEAISWLYRAADERDALLPWLNVWFLLAPLRADPRFQALRRRMNLPYAGKTGAVQ